MWSRHVSDRYWHRVVEIGDSVVTACNGRWSVTDEHHMSADPPEHTRCDACDFAAPSPGLSTVPEASPNPMDGAASFEDDEVTGERLPPRGRFDLSDSDEGPP